MKYNFNDIAADKNLDLKAYLPDIQIDKNAGEDGTYQRNSTTFQIGFNISDRIIADELLARAGFDREELEGKEISFSAGYSNEAGLDELNGILCQVSGEFYGEYGVKHAQASLTDEEKIALAEHVIAEVPQAKPFVDYTLNIVKERYEAEKANNFGIPR